MRDSINFVAKAPHPIMSCFCFKNLTTREWINLPLTILQGWRGADRPCHNTGPLWRWPVHALVCGGINNRTALINSSVTLTFSRSHLLRCGSTGTSTSESFSFTFQRLICSQKKLFIHLCNYVHLFISIIYLYGSYDTFFFAIGNGHWCWHDITPNFLSYALHKMHYYYYYYLDFYYADKWNNELVTQVSSGLEGEEEAHSCVGASCCCF